ncbi:uncharacterized protein BDV17DRAFT_219625 [Aspergillus undulatus]|uniref:uncharacterized protein n=1 Tax=Aspergillus undulatus TaxID=1810928 RepID=UPI003CCCDBB4
MDELDRNIDTARGSWSNFKLKDCFGPFGGEYLYSSAMTGTGPENRGKEWRRKTCRVRYQIQTREAYTLGHEVWLSETVNVTQNEIAESLQFCSTIKTSSNHRAVPSRKRMDCMPAVTPFLHDGSLRLLAEQSRKESPVIAQLLSMVLGRAASHSAVEDLSGH